jgi:transposase
MDKRIKFGLRDKVLVICSIQSGKESCRSAAKKLGSSKSTVQRWLSQYEARGAAGLRQRHGSYDWRLKVKVVRYMLENKLSLLRTATHFNIPNESAVDRWLKTYQRLGASGLQMENKSRKRSSMAGKTHKKSKQHTSTDTEAQKLAALQKEVEYLRAENAFLKKLDALIQQEKADKAQSKRQKPSRN